MFADNVLVRYQVLSLQERMFSPTTINVFTVGFSRGCVRCIARPDIPCQPALVLSRPPSRLDPRLDRAPVRRRNRTIVRCGAYHRNLFIDYRTSSPIQTGIRADQGKTSNQYWSVVQWVRDMGLIQPTAWHGQVSTVLQTFSRQRALDHGRSFGGATNHSDKSLGAWYVADSIQLRRI